MRPRGWSEEPPQAEEELWALQNLLQGLLVCCGVLHVISPHVLGWWLHLVVASQTPPPVWLAAETELVQHQEPREPHVEDGLLADLLGDPRDVRVVDDELHDVQVVDGELHDVQVVDDELRDVRVVHG